MLYKLKIGCLENMRSNLKVFTWAVFIIAVSALTFQAVHFSEHFAQVSVWIFGSQEKPYMTPLGMWGMEKVGLIFFPNEPQPRQSKLGFELLHFLGNAIFLFGIAAAYYFIPSKKVKWAYFIEAFHLYEHASLTLSAIFINKPIGLSTFFGMAMGQWALVAYRVWWHFIFNLIPTLLVALAIYGAYKAHRAKKESF